MINTAATNTFVQSEGGMQLTGTSHKVVIATNGGSMQASATGRLGLSKLQPGACKATAVSGSKTKALMSISPLANNGCITIFHPYQQGVTIHDTNSFHVTLKLPPVLQGCKNGACLCTVPIVDNVHISQRLNVNQAAMNVYDLPSIKETVRFLHATLGFPTKVKLLLQPTMGALSHFRDSLPIISTSTSLSWQKVRRGT